MELEIVRSIWMLADEGLLDEKQRERERETLREQIRLLSNMRSIRTEVEYCCSNSSIPPSAALLG